MTAQFLSEEVGDKRTHKPGFANARRTGYHGERARQQPSPKRAVELLKRVRVATIGPVTTESARIRGVRVDVTAREYTVPGLVQALAESY